MQYTKRDLENFAHDAQVSELLLRDIMYPKSQREAKICKEKFIPPKDLPSPAIFSSLKKECKSEKKRNNALQKNCKSSEIEQQHKDYSKNHNMDQFFRDQQSSFQKLKSLHPENEIRQFILFQSNLKEPKFVVFCLSFFKISKTNGGFINILAYNKLGQVIKELEIIFNLTNKYPPNMYFQLYKKYILAFEMFKANHIAHTTKVDIGSVKVFTHKEIDYILQNHLEDVEFNLDIMVIDNFSQYVGYDLTILSLDYFDKMYGQIVIDTRVQRSDAIGFDVFDPTMNNQQEKMTASDYFIYQKYEGTLKSKKLPICKKMKKNEVCFAVNVDLLGKPDIEGEIFKKLQKIKFMQYINQHDCLGYCEEWIPGCNHPQLYFKVKGVWTGGHQQNVSMCSVNVNFGPDQSEWISLASEHVPRFRKQIIQQFGIDIIEHEGLWFVPPQWLISNNYPVKKLIQKKGDLVFSGPGTFHWVRSLGKCFQAAWNLFPKTVKQWELSVERNRINEEIHFNHVFMPLKAFAIKILNHEYHKKNGFIYRVYESVKQWFAEQTLLVNNHIQKENIFLPRYTYRELRDIDSLCQNCRTEVLTLYSLDIEKKVICIRCYAQTSPKLRSKVYLKYHQEDIRELLSRVMATKFVTLAKLEEVEELCNGKFVGIVNCVHAQKKDSENHDNKQNITTSVEMDNNTKHQESTNEKSLEAFPHIDPQLLVNPFEMTQLFADILPKRLWNTTQEVIESMYDAINSSAVSSKTSSSGSNRSHRSSIMQIQSEKKS